jgi:hypothetical protein
MQAPRPSEQQWPRTLVRSYRFLFARFTGKRACTFTFKTSARMINSPSVCVSALSAGVYSHHVVIVWAATIF